MTREKPIIGVTIGDFNGIGPEIILKSFQGNHLSRICTPIIYGSMKVLNRYKNNMNIKDWQLFGINSAETANHRGTNVITCADDNSLMINPGQIQKEAGMLACVALKRAMQDYQSGKIDAIVTAPIAKENIHSQEFPFVGHTEFFQSFYPQNQALMFMVSEDLKVALQTAHSPLSEVSKNITKEKVSAKIEKLITVLKTDFGIQKPKIAVLGLNPHAGENGLLGTEDKNEILEAIENQRNKGKLVFGPFPADGFFAKRSYTQFDAILAMYHDQGLIPFKMLAFEKGVNFTAGLPLIRTSPDHGTAFAIAGKNQADEGSFLQALYLALDILKNRGIGE